MAAQHLEESVSGKVLPCCTGCKCHECQSIGLGGNLGRSEKHYGKGSTKWEIKTSPFSGQEPQTGNC